MTEAWYAQRQNGAIGRLHRDRDCPHLNRCSRIDAVSNPETHRAEQWCGFCSRERPRNGRGSGHYRSLLEAAQNP